jgi:DNA-binding MarR family transcriptional regulator
MSPETNDAALSTWQQRCKALGLALTPSRNAILRALLEQSEACDAVPLLQAAQTHHAGTSIGTVYRFLRELEQRGWIDAFTPQRGRTRWQLRSGALSGTAHAANDIRHMVAQVRSLLRTLEQLGLAECTATSNAASTNARPDDDRTLVVLHEIAGHLGYRLLPHRRHTA